MKRFTTVYIDSVTGMEMILSECSFNQACSFLEKQELGRYCGCLIIGDTTKITYEKRSFLYDEARGYLLGE